LFVFFCLCFFVGAGCFVFYLIVVAAVAAAGTLVSTFDM